MLYQCAHGAALRAAMLHRGMGVTASTRPVYAPTWYTDTMMAVSEPQPLAGDVDVEVCVVGAGLAGLTTALELARRGFCRLLRQVRR